MRSPRTPERRGSEEDTARERERRRQLVLEWQGAVYSLAYRMLRHEADVADVTQEIFVQVFRKLDQYDSRRPFRPWLYRVATNVVYRYLRDTKRRVEKESAVAMANETPDTREDLERRELGEIVQERLDELPEESRALLVLHYFDGLSQREVADALDLPRTTVADRLRKALTSLKSGMERGGCAALVPGVESYMKTAGPLAVPQTLSQNLLTLAHGSVATGALSTGVTIGGLIVSQKIIITAFAVVAVICLGTGMGIGGAFSGGNAAAPAAEDSTELSQALSTSEERADQLAQELKSLKRELDELRRSNDTLSNRFQEQEKELAATREQLEMATREAPPVDPSAVDWDQLAAAFADNYDLLTRISELLPGGMRALRNGLTPEEQMAMQQLVQKWAGEAMKARTKTPFPFIDEEILPNLLDSMLGDTLELSAAQRSELSRLSLDLIAEHADLEDYTPLTVYVARQKILDGVHGYLGENLTGAQQDRWGAIQPAAAHLLEGDRGDYRFGLDSGDGFKGELLDHWQDTYGFDAGQRSRAQKILESYITGARDLVEQNQRDDLTEEQREEIRQEFLALQLRMEKQLLPMLDEQQQADLQRKMPTLIDFEPGGNINATNQRWGGF